MTKKSSEAVNGLAISNMTDTKRQVAASRFVPQILIAAVHQSILAAAVFVVIVNGACVGQSPQVPLNRPNVLFVVVDDLRPELACYGHSQIHSPNIDRLASRGIVFERAYCQVTLCNPSRASVLTGKRPDTTGVMDNGRHIRDGMPDVVTLPQLFKDHGYYTQGLGKVFHPGLDDDRSWSVPHWDPVHSSIDKTGDALVQEMKAYYGPEGQLVVQSRLDEAIKSGKTVARLSRRDLLGPAWEMTDAEDDSLIDGQVAERAMQALRDVKDRPFFLAVGFLKPHLPFSAPKKYWEFYPSDTIQFESYLPPKGVPLCALHEWSELRGFTGIRKSGPISEADARQLIRGYRSATSYIDAQIGRVLGELDRLDLRRNTIVVLLSDHGYQLGEHGLWCKHSNFELAARAPLIISPPECIAAGSHTPALVELVDLYPTLAELAGLPVPTKLEGMSLVPLLDQPARPWKRAVFTQCRKPDQEGIVGRSMRTDRWRYTEWTTAGNERIGTELYDHSLDPNENVNSAADPKHKARLTALESQMREGWKFAEPSK